MLRLARDAARRRAAVRPGGWAFVTAIALSPAASIAAEIGTLTDEPVSLDVTNTGVLLYQFDNRNDTREPGTRVDDSFGAWLDRFNVQLAWWRLRFGLRIDAAAYAGVTSLEEAQELAIEDEAKVASPDPNARTDQYVRELHTRYKRAIYASKLWLGYTQPGIDATVGDFYAQLGRGLVFSVRKIDELAIDTTVRGGKLVVDRTFGPVSLGATFFGGQMNPLRVDETSGRRLNAIASPLFFGFPEPSDLRTYGEGLTPAAPSYLPDSVLGGRFEAGLDVVQIAANGAVLLREGHAEERLRCELTRPVAECAAAFPSFAAADASLAHDQIRSFSGSVNVPSIAGHGDLYVEVAGQQLRDGRAVALDTATEEARHAEDLSGHAVYASATARGGPVAVSLEGKHYRSFFPLKANIDAVTPGFGAPEFNVVAYNNPPTAEPIYVQPVAGAAPNLCVTGGRVRADYRFDPKTSVYGWLGRYASWSELDARNERCDTDAAKQTNTWDFAVGTELELENGKSHARVWMGARLTDRVEEVDFGQGPSSVFYREGYIRYDLVKHLGGPFSLQFQGFHRRRFEPVAFAEPWMEGENYTALQWSPHVVAIFGYEYFGKKGCDPGSEDPLCHYVNGGLQWRSSSSERVVERIFDTVSLFVGQRRGAIRCVSGVCRQFPPFEGARLEIVSRF